MFLTHFILSLTTLLSRNIDVLYIYVKRTLEICFYSASIKDNCKYLKHVAVMVQFSDFSEHARMETFLVSFNLSNISNTVKNMTGDHLLGVSQSFFFFMYIFSTLLNFEYAPIL